MGGLPEGQGRSLVIGRLILALALVFANSVVATKSLAAQIFAVLYSFHWCGRWRSANLGPDQGCGWHSLGHHLSGRRLRQWNPVRTR